MSTSQTSLESSIAYIGALYGILVQYHYLCIHFWT